MLQAIEPTALLAAIVASSDDAIVSKDLSGVITSWNGAAERMFGYTADEAVGQNITMIIPPERLAEEAYVLGRVGEGLGVDHFETVRMRKDGSRFNISLTVSPVRDRHGAIIGCSKIARDITEQKQSADRLRVIAEENGRLFQAAERANQVKDDFLATLSHELRTPLHSILGWSQILDLDVDDVAKARAVETIQRNARLQARLINDLLDISRIVAGKLALKRERVDLASIISAAIEDARPAVAAKRITLGPPVPNGAAEVVGDRGRLQQVVGNLLSNAVKFTPPGGRIDIALDLAGDEAAIAITDTGAGIAPEFLPHVFDRFRQADGSSTRRHGGLGLGLGIVKHVTEAHGGTAEAASGGEGQGATFTIRLPLHS